MEDVVGSQVSAINAPHITTHLPVCILMLSGRCGGGSVCGEQQSVRTVKLFANTMTSTLHFS